MLGLDYIFDCLPKQPAPDGSYGRFEAACLRNRICRRVRLLERAFERCTHDAGLTELEENLERYRRLHDMVDPGAVSCGDRIIVDAPLRAGIHQCQGIVLGYVGAQLAVRLECPPTSEDILLAQPDVVRMPHGELAGEWTELRREAGIAPRRRTRRPTYHGRSARHQPTHTLVRRLVMRYRLEPERPGPWPRRSLSMVTAAMLILPLLIGCQGATARYQAELARAHHALEIGHTGQASRALASANTIAQQHDLTRAVAHDLLEAEVHLQDGDALTALSITQQVASSAPSHSIERAMAEEIIGKSAVRHGDFDAALTHFATAAALYETGADHQRIADLTRLARGLSAYATGDLGTAQEEWSGIMNEDLRSALEQARNDLEVAARY